jgi:hypothetical protein
VPAAGSSRVWLTAAVSELAGVVSTVGVTMNGNAVADGYLAVQRRSIYGRGNVGCEKNRWRVRSKSGGTRRRASSDIGSASFPEQSLKQNYAASFKGAVTE